MARWRISKFNSGIAVFMAITYVWSHEGLLYLAVRIDLFSRRVVGWSLSKRMKVDRVCDALLMAIWRRKPGRGLIHLSDRGSQYACHEYQDILKDIGMTMSPKV